MSDSNKQRQEKHNNDNVISIHIDDQNCWVCGREARDKHHALPKRLKPKHNIFIPVCRNCHELIHPESYPNATPSVQSMNDPSGLKKLWDNPIDDEVWGDAENVQEASK